MLSLEESLSPMRMGDSSGIDMTPRSEADSSGQVVHHTCSYATIITHELSVSV